MTSVDVTNWEPAEEEYLGTKPKQWPRSPLGQLWLWKESTTHHDARHGQFRKGDDWSEVVACRIGQRLGVPVAAVELATRGDCFGVVSRKVSDDDTETLVHGNELLAEIGIVPPDPHDRTGYSVESVARALAGIGPPSPSEDLKTAFDWFAGYLLLDALIGNTDRHQDNWAAIRSHAGPLHLVGERPRRHWIDALEHAPDLHQLVDDLPDERMSTPAKRFSGALYGENLASLSYPLSTMGT